MSLRRSTTIGRGNRPAQVFKKRNNLFDTSVPNNSNATLLSEIVLRETGTIYSIKIGCTGIQISGTGQDTQRIELWCRCVPATTTLPDFTVGVVQDTINGFFVGTLTFVGGLLASWNNIPNIKFRFRRKCDENSLVQLIAQSSPTQGTGRTVEIAGLMAAVIRVK